MPALPGDPSDHMNALLKVLLPFARDSVGDHGGFFPFGASLAPDGQLEAAAAYEADEGDDEPTPDDVLATIRDGLRERAGRDELIATGVCSGVTIEEGEFPLGIRVELEHRDGEPITCVVPYRIDGDGYGWGAPFSFPGEHRIWDGAVPST